MTATEVVARQKVSIHALLVECDPLPARSFTSGWGFNPRTPCGVRPMEPGGPEVLSEVSITHSLWVRPRAAISSFRVCGFNPRTPCECDSSFSTVTSFPNGFNPRTPCGVRQSLASMAGSSFGFNPRTPCGVRRASACGAGLQAVSIHALLVECDSLGKTSDPLSAMVSIHALLVECDCSSLSCRKYPPCFNPRTPCGVRRWRAQQIHSQ